MGVGRRQVPHMVYYLYPLHRSDPPRHALGCPHRAEARTGGGNGETVPVLEVKNGKIQVNLGSPLYRGQPTGGNEDGGPDKEETAPSGKKKSPCGKLLTLLEVLWSEAELNVWRPWFDGKRTYGVIYHRLQEAASKIRVRRQDLSPLLYIPRPYRDTHAAEIQAERQRFLEHLREQDGKRYYGYTLGLLKEVVEKEGENIALRLAHTSAMLWIKRGKWERAKKKWFPHGDIQLPSAILARVMRHEGKRYPWLTVEEITMLSLSDEKSWIPVDSTHERILAGKLVTEQRLFRKPLTCEMSAGELLPGFVLEDRDDRAYLEILGLMEDPEYRAHVVKKRVAYEKLQQVAWWWDVLKDKEPPPLPPGRQRYKKDIYNEAALANNSEPFKAPSRVST